MKNFHLEILAFALLAIVACSGDDSTSAEQSLAVGSALKKIQECSEAEQGRFLIVEEALYICNGGYLYALDGTPGEDGLPGEDGTYCVTSVLPDGWEILCDEDSVGFISNGLGGKDGSYCVSELAEGGVNIICGGEVLGFLKDGIPGQKGSDGSDGKSGSFLCSTVETEAGYDVYCNDEKVGSVSKGAKGDNGKNGLKGKDGSYCISKYSEMGYDIVCDGNVVGQILNGKSGKKGENGLPGKDGKYCIEDTTSTGFSFICDGVFSGSVLNGEKGDDGTAGSDALGCTFEKNEDGSYTHRCGDKTSIVYPGICGEELYLDEQKFCVGNVLYDKCLGSRYNLETQFCGTTGVLEKCDGFVYDDEYEFCQEGVVLKKCNGETYDFNTHFCKSNKILEKCNGKSYSEIDSYCNNGTVYSKCNGVPFNTEEQFCLSSTLYDLCDGQEYYTHQFCFKGKIYYGKWNSTTGKYESYNPELTGNYYGQCGSTLYNLEKEYCYNVETPEVRTYTLFKDERDEHVYPSVLIGTQEWIAADLGNVGSWYYPSVSRYSWSEANSDGFSNYCQSQFIVGEPLVENQGKCPVGWHIPSIEEWQILHDYIDANNGSEGVGTSLKKTSGWSQSSGVPVGTDRFGFRAVNVGSSWYEVVSNNRTEYKSDDSETCYWSSESISETNAYGWCVSKNNAQFQQKSLLKSHSYSVRCVKN